MIDEKKINEAALDYLETVHKDYKVSEPGNERHSYYDYPIEEEALEEQFIDDFKAGANWMAQESKKHLWHDVQEKPQDDVDLLLEEFLYDNNSNVMYYAIYNHDESMELWQLFANRRRVNRWLYIDDLVKTVK